MKDKNVIFITTDQQRKDTLDKNSHYHTPNLDALLEKGVTFSNHICTSAQCTPSRATWMTGRYPHEVGVNVIGHKLNVNDENIAKVFKKNGFETLYFGKWHLGGEPSDYGFDVTNYSIENTDYWGTNNQSDYYSYKDAQTTAQALNYLGDRKKATSTKFFMHVSWYLPHPNNPGYGTEGPFENLPVYDELYEKEKMPIPTSFYEDDLSTKPNHQKQRAMSAESRIDEEIIKYDAQKYSKLVSLLDRNLGKILDKLEKENLLENTMIVFSSDHGDMQGAHRLRLKGVVPYKELYNIPLIMYIPWITSKRNEISDLTSNASIPGTLLDAVNIEVPELFYKSLLPLLNELETNQESRVFIEHYKAYWGEHPFRGIQTLDYKYVYYYQDDVEEMYDLKNDPDELKNISSDPKYQDQKNKLSAEVESWWEETGGLTRKPIIDEESSWVKSSSIQR